MNKKIIATIIIIIIAIIGCVFLAPKNNDSSIVKSEEKTIEEKKLTITTTSFSTYDLIKHIVGDKMDVVYLLNPGVDAHSYEPSASDLVKIQNADIFIYIGGEMEKWTDKVIDSDVLDTKNTELIKVSTAVDTIEEQEIDGAEEEEEEEEEGAFDEHIWTSPENAIKMVNALEKAMEKIDSENAIKYNENAEKYIAQIKEVDSKI